MEVCGLSKARPIVCNDSPAFQRRHTSARCATESSTYFPCVINTTPGRKIYIRWCCIDLLNAPDLSGTRDRPTQDILSTMPVRKFFLRFLAIYAAAFVLVYLIPEHIHRRDFDRAFSVWLHDRTPQ